MNHSVQTLALMKKANKLARLAQRKNDPKSYKRGQGALPRALLEHDSVLQSELTSIPGINRAILKDTVRKATRNGYVTIDIKGEKSYVVALTGEGRELAERREKSQDAIPVFRAGKIQSANGFVASYHRAAEGAHDRDLPKTGTKMD